MAQNLRHLGFGELCRVVNSTALGAVLTPRQLNRHRVLAGLRIGGEKHVDLIRYMAWLAQRRHDPEPPPEYKSTYERVKDVAAKRSKDIFESGRDIGPIPEVASPEQKHTCKGNFRLFCDTYFPFTFNLPWSNDHLKIIEKIETAVLQGGLFATAMPRGSGKTTIAEVACIWSVLYGHREFVALIGSDEGHAMQLLDSIKTELESNEHLLADFPEAVYPIERLEGIANRCNGQLHNGERTHIGWTAKEVVLPTIPGSVASGAIIKVAGLTGGIRGMKYKRVDGQAVRPTLVVIDDPQTDESARSPIQCATRESILAGAVLGLAGPGKKISGIMPCTVIRPGDMADSILNRDKHPEWNGERTKMVYSFPTNEKLWDQYATIRAESLRNDHGGAEATEFYRENRDAMDEGAAVAWEARFNHDELSALQNAMNLKLRNEHAFFAEYQNEPLPTQAVDESLLTADDIATKLNRMARGLVPLQCTRLTAFIDVQGTLLYYVVAGWEDDFTGYVIDYGTYPDQKRPYFSLRDAKLTLATATKAAGQEGQIYAGLELLTAHLMGREWPRDGGSVSRIDRCMIDSGFWTDVIHQFCRQSAHAANITPSKGLGIGIAARPMAEYINKPGDRVGLNWRMPLVQGKRAVRHAVYDTNFWKSFVQTRLAVPMGDRGCLSLFGDKPATHRLLADHLTAEYRIVARRDGDTRVVPMWKEKPERPDNHWLDCLVGCAVAASIQGATLPGTTEAKPTKRQRVSFAAMQAAARGKQ